MKKWIFALALLAFLPLGMRAQDARQKEQEVFEAKVALMESSLGLDESQKAPFRNLYSDYEAEVNAASAPLRTLRSKQKRDSGGDYTMQQARIQAPTTLRVSRTILDIKESYLDDFSAILKPDQLLKFFRTETSVRNRINKEFKSRNPSK